VLTAKKSHTMTQHVAKGKDVLSLFICSSFNDTVSNSDYRRIASDSRTAMNKELERMCKESAVT
jgi:hypothetical protein